MNADIPTLPLIVVCLALSFLLSGMEAGVFALSRLRVRQLMRAGRNRARVLHGFLEHPENFLWTILVGNTLANFVAVALLVTRLHETVGGHSGLFVAGLLVIVFLLYALFELLPKMLFRQFPNRLCLGLAVPFQFVHLALSPLVALMERLARGLLRWTGGRTFTGHLFGNRDELRLVMQESAQNLTSEERAMINRVLDLQHVTVRQIAVPLEKLVTVTAQTPIVEVLQLCRERQLTRLPVWQEEHGRKRIAGLVSLRSVLYDPGLDPGRLAGEFVQPALYLEEDQRLEVALQRMQRGGQRLAVVLGRDQRESGIVSLEDILKVIFGEVKL